MRKRHPALPSLRQTDARLLCVKLDAPHFVSTWTPNRQPEPTFMPLHHGCTARINIRTSPVITDHGVSFAPRCVLYARLKLRDQAQLHALCEFSSHLTLSALVRVERNIRIEHSSQWMRQERECDRTLSRSPESRTKLNLVFDGTHDLPTGSYKSTVWLSQPNNRCSLFKTHYLRNTFLYFSRNHYAMDDQAHA